MGDSRNDAFFAPRRVGSRRMRFGLGLAALGRPAYITVAHDEDFPEGRTIEAMEAHAHRMLDAAMDAGIRYVDAARSYGRAEQFLHSWLARGSVPEDLVIGSKWGYRYVGDWKLDAPKHEVKDHSVEALRAQWSESHGLLGDRLALYQIHSATKESGVLENAAVLDELARIRDAHQIRMGVTTSGPNQAETILRALEIDRGGTPLFSTVQATWNLLERSAGDALREAHDSGRTVLVKEAMANGRLAPRGDRAQGALADLAEDLGVATDAVALAAVLAQPWADVVLIGAATEEQLASNLLAEHVALNDARLAAVESLRMDPEEYWAERSGLPWR